MPTTTSPAEYDERRARAGLIVPSFETITEADESDPDGWYERVTVTDAGSMYERTIRGAWHGRVTERTELRWFWREDADPHDRWERRPVEPRRSFRDLFRRRPLAG